MKKLLIWIAYKLAGTHIEAEKQMAILKSVSTPKWKSERKPIKDDEKITNSVMEDLDFADFYDWKTGITFWKKHSIEVCELEQDFFYCDGTYRYQIKSVGDLRKRTGENKKGA